MALNIRKSYPVRVYPINNIPKDALAAGSKARTLGRLMKAGYPVPPGFCVILDEEAFAPASNAENRESEMPVSGMRDDVQQEILRAYQQLRNQRSVGIKVAVRSSAPGEDTNEQSFAGQFESMLNISNETELFRAIQSSWETASQRQAKVVGQEQGLFTYAVVVQEMVNPVLAGVVFSIHPVSGNRNHLVVEAVPGIGDQLMAGLQEPARLIFDKSHLQLIDHYFTADFPEEGKSDRYWQPLLEMVLQIEGLLDGAVDIEFAHDGDRFWILQARPITTFIASSPVTEENPYRLLTRANIGEIMPDVVTPLTWTTFLRTLELEENPARPVRPSRMAVLQNGLAHIDLQMLWDSYQSLLGISAEVILTRGIGCDLSGIESHLRAHTRRESLRSTLLKNIYVWGGLLAPDVFDKRLTRHFDAVRLSFSAWQNAAPSQPEWLADGLQKLLSITARAFLLHQQTTFLGMCAYGALATRLSASKQSGEIDKLLAYHLPQSQNRRRWESGIAALVDKIEQNPELVEIFKRQDVAHLKKTLAETPVGREFWTALREVVQTAGDRGANEFELASPRWSEDPAVVLGIIRSSLLQQAKDTVPERETISTDPPRHSDEKNTPVVNGWLNRRLYRALILYRMWREKSKYLLMQCFGQLRRIYLQIGRLLTQQHILTNPEEIFFLHLTEIEQLLRGKVPWKLHEQLSLRIETFRSQKQAQSGIEHLVTGPGDKRFSGIPVSSGAVTGPVKIMRSPDTPLHPGEVIVATATDPGWAPLFSVCSGIVTEIGGMLSHTAILAREMNKPAVFGVSGITAMVHDGQSITVDGSRGEIVIHAEE